MTWSRLYPFIADDHDSGKPDSVLVLKGFANRDEILKFVRALMDAGLHSTFEDKATPEDAA